jgi:hypothetical protein
MTYLKEEKVTCEQKDPKSNKTMGLSIGVAIGVAQMKKNE